MSLYLFQCGSTELHALSTDIAGCNLPRMRAAWLLRKTLPNGPIPKPFVEQAKEASTHGYSILLPFVAGRKTWSPD